MKKHLIATILVSLTLNPLPVLAQNPESGLNIDTFLNSDLWNFITVLANKIGIKQNIIADIESGLNKLDGLAGIDTGDIVVNQEGAMGSIDIEEALRQIDKTSLDSNTGLTKGTIKNIVTSKIADGYTNSILSKEAQETNLDEQEKVAEAVQKVGTLQNEADDEVITQNVMKKIAEQNAQMATINGTIYAANEELRTGLAINAKLASKNLEQETLKLDKERAEKQKMLAEESAAIAIFGGMF